MHRDSKSIPTIWKTWHVTTYAVTAVLGFVSSIVFYLGLVQSHYHCYQYNAVLMVHEWSRDKYEPYLLDQAVWYQNEYCYNSFLFPLKVFVNSIVWMSMCIVFGRGGTVLSEFDYSKYFRFVKCFVCVFKCKLKKKKMLSNYLALQYARIVCFIQRCCCRSMAYSTLGHFVQFMVFGEIADKRNAVNRRIR